MTSFAPDALSSLSLLPPRGRTVISETRCCCRCCSNACVPPSLVAAIFNLALWVRLTRATTTDLLLIFCFFDQLDDLPPRPDDGRCQFHSTTSRRLLLFMNPLLAYPCELGWEGGSRSSCVRGGVELITFALLQNQLERVKLRKLFSGGFNA